MLFDSKVNALQLQSQCFTAPKAMLSSRGMHAFRARKLCFKKVEEEWKRKSSLPRPETSLYKGVFNDLVEVEEKKLKIFERRISIKSICTYLFLFVQIYFR